MVTCTPTLLSPQVHWSRHSRQTTRRFPSCSVNVNQTVQSFSAAISLLLVVVVCLSTLPLSIDAFSVKFHEAGQQAAVVHKFSTKAPATSTPTSLHSALLPILKQYLHNSHKITTTPRTASSSRTTHSIPLLNRVHETSSDDNTEQEGPILEDVPELPKNVHPPCTKKESEDHCFSEGTRECLTFYGEEVICRCKAPYSGMRCDMLIPPDE